MSVIITDERPFFPAFYMLLCGCFVCVFLRYYSERIVMSSFLQESDFFSPMAFPLCIHIDTHIRTSSSSFFCSPVASPYLS